MEMDTVLKTKGVIDDELYDMNNTNLTPEPVVIPPSPNEAPPIEMPDGTLRPARFVKLRIPTDVSDQEVNAATNFGFSALQNAQNGICSIIFPHTNFDPDGKPVPSMAKFEMLMTSPKDIERLLKVAEVISNMNVEILRAEHNPIEKLSTEKNANINKDNIVRDAIAKAEGGKGGIIITG